MKSLQQLNKSFLIEQLKRATYAHTSTIRCLHKHKTAPLGDRQDLLKDIAYYRRLARSCIRELRAISF